MLFSFWEEINVSMYKERVLVLWSRYNVPKVARDHMIERVFRWEFALDICDGRAQIRTKGTAKARLEAHERHLANLPKGGRNG